MKSFLEIHNQMKVNTIALFFKGYVTFELVDSIIMIIAEKLEKVEEDKNIRKKVYGILTECLQNLCSHIEKDDSGTESLNYDINSAVIMVDSDQEGYFIKTGNFVSNSKVEGLIKWLEQINSISHDQLKELYNKILTNKSFSDKGGGGLGLVDIARKSGEKLEYNFEKIDDKFSFFSFQTKINRNKNSK